MCPIYYCVYVQFQFIKVPLKHVGSSCLNQHMADYDQDAFNEDPKKIVIGPVGRVNGEVYSVQINGIFYFALVFTKNNY